MNILVVSGCSGDKRFDEAPIGCEAIDSTSRDELLGEYPDSVARAGEMYTGDEHEHVHQAVTNLRSHADVTWRIVSAGYGLLAADEEIVAYDCSFSDIGPVRDRANRMGYEPDALTIDETRRGVGRELNIPGDLRELLTDGYDLVFVVLSEPYFVVASEALTGLSEGVTALAFASNGSRPLTGDAYWVPATEDVRAELGTNWFSLRGVLLRRLSTRVDKSGLAQLAKSPETMAEFVPAIRQARLEQ